MLEPKDWSREVVLQQDIHFQNIERSCGSPLSFLIEADTKQNPLKIVLLIIRFSIILLELNHDLYVPLCNYSEGTSSELQITDTLLQKLNGSLYKDRNCP